VAPVVFALEGELPNYLALVVFALEYEAHNSSDPFVFALCFEHAKLFVFGRLCCGL
jgi:hypothetical protein